MTNKRREKRHYRQHLVASAAKVFPLICPVEEAKWLDGFEYKMAFSESGVAELGCVFITEYPGEPDTVWIVTRHDPQKRVVEFTRMTPGWLVTQLEVRLLDIPDDHSAADITYTYTSLGPDGDRALENRHSQEGFDQMVRVWEKSLNHYLSSGQVMRAVGRS